MSIDNDKRGNWSEEGPKLFLQGLFETSTTQKHPLGTPRNLSDGRKFVYCKAGAANIAAGVLLQSPAPDVANEANLAITANASKGDKSISFTLGNSTRANTANAFAEGWAYISSGNGAGQSYKIKLHAAIAANANGTLYLSDKLRSALTAGNSMLSLGFHKCSGVIIQPSPPTGALVGVTTQAVLANEYFWAQSKGEASVLADGTVVNGDAVRASDGVDGAVEPVTANGGFETERQVGTVMANNANTHYALVDLDL